MAAAAVLTAALGYALRGWQVIPLHNINQEGACSCGRSSCTSPGKHPRLRKWPGRATTNREQIGEWWSKWPQANVGVVTGTSSGLVVLDVDPRHYGDLSLSELESKHGDLSAGLRCSTGGGGFHIYLAHPDFHVRNSAGSLGPGLDVRADGGFVVAPPSNHISGAPYAWTTDPAEQAGTIPQWMADALTTKRDQVAREAQQKRKEWENNYSAIVAGVTGYGAKALHLKCEAVSRAAEGTRNNQLNRSAFSIGQLVGGGELDRAEARTALLAAAMGAGLERPEAEAACDSGLNAGAQSPRTRPIKAPRPSAKPAKVEIDASDWVSPDLETWQLLDRATATDDRPRDPKRTGRNVRIILDNDPRLRGRFWGDRTRGLRYWGDDELADEHCTRLANVMDELYSLVISTAVIREQVLLACLDNDRDPLTEWLHALTWDGEHRMEHLLSRGFGSDPSNLNRFYSMCWGVGCVARAYRPGCKVDTCLILVGAQGIGKSSGMRDLVGEEWFSDTEIAFGDGNNKDALHAFRRPWVHEFAELSTLRRAKGDKVKAILSSQVDEYRPSYGREVVRFPRRCVLIGTSNEPQILMDTTGSRRFWPVKVTHVDRKWLQDNRAQLWAEAAHYYREGAQWWLPDPAEAERISSSELFIESDPWQDLIEDHLATMRTTTVSALMDKCLKLDRSQQGISASRRVGAILRGMGWERGKGPRTDDGKRPRVWRAPGDED